MSSPSVPSQLTAALSPRYEIERELGRGGMATVYLARDTRHERLVAVKVLDPELAASVGAERFLAEIRLTAQLHHPNILALFDSGEANGLLYYVMPYIAGETLRARLERERQLPVATAVHIAIAVGQALEHAHKAGVIHRDLKPENILVNDGEPLVADFGIALALKRAGGERLTLTGLSLGTPQYMSPEQATGDRVIDARADIFSLGCMLYEMLAGETPFAAATAQATIARIVTEKPRAIASIRTSVPSHVAATIDRALEKLPADRWTTAREFADALSDANARPQGPALRERKPVMTALPWVIAAAAIGVAATVVATRPRASNENAATLRFPIVTADSNMVLSASTPGVPFAISPDDRRIVYVSRAIQGRARLITRGLDEMAPRPLTGTEGFPLQPTVSPDGRQVAFLLDDRLVRMSIDGGPITPIRPAEGLLNAGMEWFAADTILASTGGALFKIPVSGATTVPLSRPDTAAGEMAQWGPHRISDEWIAYISTTREGISSYRVALLSLKTKRATITAHRGTTVLGAIDGRLVWVQTNGVVMAAPLSNTGVLGDPVPILDGVLVRPGGAAKATLSPRGSLLYEHGESMSQLVAVDFTGRVASLGADAAAYAHPRWSPDGKRLALAIGKSGTSDLYVSDATAKTFGRLTSGGLNDVAEWTRDGQHLIYRSVQPRGTTLEWLRADGMEAQAQLVGNGAGPYQGIMTRDMKTLIYRTGDGAPTPRHIFAMSLDNKVVRDLTPPGSSEADPHLSPDDRWLAFSGSEGNEWDIYVRAFPGPGPRYRVSTDGGQEPMWSRDGRTLYYRVGRSMMAAAFTTSPSFAVTSRTKLFDGIYLSDGSHANYDLMPDGQRFLMLQSVDRQSETVMVYGWANELRRRWSKP